jgi:hypothetical protein
MVDLARNQRQISYQISDQNKTSVRTSETRPWRSSWSCSSPPSSSSWASSPSTSSGNDHDPFVCLSSLVQALHETDAGAAEDDAAGPAPHALQQAASRQPPRPGLRSTSAACRAGRHASGCAPRTAVMPRAAQHQRRVPRRPPRLGLRPTHRRDAPGSAAPALAATPRGAPHAPPRRRLPPLLGLGFGRISRVAARV